MKAGVAVILIVVGAFLIALPPMSDAVHQMCVVELLERPDFQRVVLQGTMGDVYRAGCFLMGTFMIVTAVIFSFSLGLRRKDHELS